MSSGNPIDSMQEWFERMNREFADATSRWDADVEALAASASPPEVDVVDAAEEYVVTVDLPGYSAEDVTATVTDRTLYVEAEGVEDSETVDGEYVRQERRHRSLSRAVRLPDPVDTDAVDATMNNGVLTVTVPKAIPAEESHEIDIS